MPRLVGVDIPGDKQIAYSLRYIHGIGLASAKRILKDAGIEVTVRAKDLTDEQLQRIVTIIQNDFVVEGQLRRMVSQNVARLRDINCWRGIRHRRGLPVRGQRTQTNARTRKGRKKTVAGKRSVKEMR